MKTIIRAWSIVSMLMACAVVRAAEPDPQVITMEDGTKLTFLGVTTGTRHMAPGYEKLATANWLYTRDNATVAWVMAEHDPKKWPSFELLVSDTANTGFVNMEKRTGSHVRDGVDIQGFVLDAFPRWDKETILRVRPYRGVPAKGHWVMTNSPPAAYANWSPKPLPDTEADGDLEVTLTKLVAGMPMPYRDGGKLPETNDPVNRCVGLDFNFRQNGQPTTNWQVWPVITSDAAGNRARAFISAYPANGIIPSYPDRIHPSFPSRYDGFFYQPGLWPDEPAWKVRLEFTRTSGYSEDEMVTFTNLSVRAGTKQDTDEEWTWEPGQTNLTFVESMVNGVHLKIFSPILIPDPDHAGEKRIIVTVKADRASNLQAMRLTVLKATDEQERELWCLAPASQTTPFGNYAFDLMNPRDATVLNLKFAMHKSRFVEFTVKPAKE